MSDYDGSRTFWIAGAFWVLNLFCLVTRRRSIANGFAAVIGRARAVFQPVVDLEGDDSGEFVSKEVEAQLCQKRKDLVGHYVNYVPLMWCCVYAWQCLKEIRGSERWESDGLDTIHAIIAFTLIAINLLPGALTANTAICLGCGLYLCHTLAMSQVVCPPCVVSMLDYWYMYPSLILSLCAFIGHWRLGLLCNLCYAAVVLHSYTAFGGAECSLSHEASGKLSIGAAFVSRAAAIGVALVLEAYVRENIRLDVQRRISQSELAAARSLMSLMCDAAVELDSDLRVVTGAQQLAVMLLLASPQSAQGKELTHFVHGHEQQQFKEFIDRVSHTPGLNTQVFHLPLRDSQGNKISMEFFHVCFMFLGHVRHLVGIREMSDPVVDRFPSGTLREFAIREQPRDPGPVAVSFGAITLECSDGCSSAFIETFGPPPRKLSDWISPTDNVKFWADYKQELDKFAESEEHQAGPTELGMARLRVSYSGSEAGTHFTAACRVVFTSASNDTGPTKPVATMQMQDIVSYADAGRPPASISSGSVGSGSGISRSGSARSCTSRSAKQSASKVSGSGMSRGQLQRSVPPASPILRSEQRDRSASRAEVGGGSLSSADHQPFGGLGARQQSTASSVLQSGLGTCGQRPEPGEGGSYHRRQEVVEHGQQHSPKVHDTKICSL